MFVFLVIALVAGVLAGIALSESPARVDAATEDRPRFARRMLHLPAVVVVVTPRDTIEARR